VNRLKGCVIGQKVCNGEWICDWVYVRLVGKGGWGGVEWGVGRVCGCVRNTKALPHLHFSGQASLGPGIILL
jgi:hypothetical protein